QAVLVEDHLHPILPELPRLRRDVLVDALTEFAGPRRRVESRQLLLELLAEHHAARGVADGLRRRRGPARISHAVIVLPSARARCGRTARGGRREARHRRRPIAPRARRWIRDSWRPTAAAAAAAPSGP